ncbi:MAG: dockerin type I domain-containing protein [Nanoarchaeota archaeon]
MTKDSNGTYSYSYSIGASAIGGVWETVVSVVIKGQTIKRNDYWSLSSSPADVKIIDITDKVIPTITANVRIDNKGTAASDFYYVYCIVSSADNLCGGNDDVASGSATAFINAGSFISVTLTLSNVLTAGTYWLKVKARALAETNWAAATEQFTAENIPGGGGGGGGGGGILPSPIAVTCTKRADFNCDNKVNSIDFSILLYYWKSQPPFKNIYVDINKDNKVDSVDFSILLYEWGK